MSKKGAYRKEKPVQLFEVGQEYKIFNYVSNKMCLLRILDRRDKWLLISLDGIEKEVRATPVSNPLSESILLDDYTPVFSYQKFKKEKDNE